MLCPGAPSFPSFHAPPPLLSLFPTSNTHLSLWHITHPSGQGVASFPKSLSFHPACKKLWQGNKYWERKKPTTQKRGRSSSLGPTGHEDAELNSNPPIPGSRCICTWSYCSLPAAALNILFLETKLPAPFFTSDRWYIEYRRGGKEKRKPPTKLRRKKNYCYNGVGRTNLSPATRRIT